jgi:hypothetical protein
VSEPGRSRRPSIAWRTAGTRQAAAPLRTPSERWLVFALAFVAAASGFLRVLAETTNVIIPAVFFAVNASLIGVRLRKVPRETPTSFEILLLVPIAGALVATYLVTRFSQGAYGRAAALAASEVVLYLLARRRGQGLDVADAGPR